jgi:diguanylate cyclase (GGDEF)-like protein
MVPLDPLTLAIYSAGVGTLLTLLAVLYWRARGAQPGFGHWVASLALFAAAMLCISLRDAVPWLYNPGTTSALLLAVWAAHRGTRLYFGTSAAHRWADAIMALPLVAVLVTNFTDITLQRVIGALATAALAVLTARTFVRRAPEALRVPALFCAAVFALFAVQRLLRIEFYLMPSADQAMLASVPSSAFNYVVNALVTTFWAFGFLFLDAMRSEAALASSREELREMSLSDPLTGVRNRRALFEVAEREAPRRARYGGGVALLMVDVDHFKPVNDSHGHLVGDEVLKRVARAIEGEVRASDLVARFGGEEFAVLLLEVDAEEARTSAERIRAAIAGVEVLAPAGTVRVTASVGVALAEREGFEMDALARRADDALYRAKREGRDRVAVG